MVNAGVENIVDHTMGPLVPENFLCWQKEKREGRKRGKERKKRRKRKEKRIERKREELHQLVAILFRDRH